MFRSKRGSDIKARARALHKKLGGKIAISNKAPIRSRDDLSLLYTPGVGAVSDFVAKHPLESRSYTIQKNTVAVVSDGSAVLGLGNIGAAPALPVMEGKAMLFKSFAGIDAFPIVFNTQDSDEIIATVRTIAPTFGGINLEDIAAPRCFYIEEQLKKELDIPVMHDDQHGTAIVVLAALINALKIVGKRPREVRVVIIGAGAAGVAVAKLLQKHGIPDVVVTDRKGIITRSRTDLPAYKKELAKATNPRKLAGDMTAALQGADVVIGVSGSNRLRSKDIALMAERAIVFALANPVPEIMPEEAKRGGAHVIATGRSDFPNQVNNALVFPGVFRGALDHNVESITDVMKLKAARSLAGLVGEPKPAKILPALFDKKIVPAIAKAIR